LVACATLATAPALAQNLIQNGSFESPALGVGNWNIFPGGIPNWSITTGSGIEVQSNVAGTALAGDQLVELDGSDNSGMAQTVATQPGAPYLLAFGYSPRPGQGSLTNAIQVFVDGNLVANIAHDGSANADAVWLRYSYAVTATGPAMTIEFRASGTSDGVGGYVDDVTLTPIAPAAPVPGPTGSLAAALGALLLPAAWRRLRRRR
jgi:hypothetical protein